MGYRIEQFAWAPLKVEFSRVPLYDVESFLGLRWAFMPSLKIWYVAFHCGKYCVEIGQS